jgi:hypothetical protein
MAPVLEGAAITLTAAQAAVIARALAEAEQYRRDIAKTWCADCAAAPGGACPAHLAYLGPADAYRHLRDMLARMVPQPHTERPATVAEHRSWP